MPFDAKRPDRERLARLPFGDAWLALVDPTDLAACDVMDVRVRMGMYRLLVERLNPHGLYGAHDELSPFWGYASQLAWQHRSRRLGGSPHTIAHGSWWGACNYALSVIPYAAAMGLGHVPTLPFEVDHAYDEVMPAWRTAFATMTDPLADHDRVRVALWHAHLGSIRLADKRHHAAYAALPAPEQRLARGWIRMVDLYAAAAVRTDLDAVVDAGGDLPRQERRMIERVGMLADRPRWRWNVEMRVWRRIMRTSRARADADHLLAGVLGSGDHVWPVRARALAYATLPVKVVERIGAR